MKKYLFNKSAFITKKNKNKIFIFMGGESTLYSFSDTSATIIRGLRQRHSDKKIIALLIKDYFVTYDTARTDYYQFIKELVKQKLLVEVKNKNER